MQHEGNVSESFLFAFCHLVDFPPNGKDCSQKDVHKCVSCPVRGSFWTGESIHDYHSTALVYHYFFWIVLLITSIFAIFSNILIFRVFNRKETKRSFDFLIIMLAVFDLFCGVVSVGAGTSSIAYFGNWFGRGWGSVYSSLFSLYTTLFTRSLSTYIAILITVERWLMITFPHRANIWFTPTRTKIMTTITVMLAIFLNYPRFASWSLKENNWKDVPSLQELDYVLRPTDHGRFWYGALWGIHNLIDFWLPLPILLVFNLLSYRKVHELSKKRKEMNLTTKQDIRAVKMFLPVVIAFFITNIFPIVNLIVIKAGKTTYREFYMLVYISTAVNAAVNFPIYYFRSASFKTSAKAEVAELRMKLGLGGKKDDQSDQENGKTEVKLRARDSVVVSDNSSRQTFIIHSE